MTPEQKEINAGIERLGKKLIDKTVKLNQIAEQFRGIDPKDLTRLEKNILNILKEKA